MKKILVIQQKMIGDVLVSSILCNNLKKAYPNSQVDYMVYESTVDVLEGNPYIDNLILFKKKHRKNTFTFLKLIFSLRNEKYDIVIDSYSKLESWFTVFFLRSSRRISFKKRGREFLYNDNVERLEIPKTNVGLIIERRLSLLNPLNLKADLNPVPQLYVSDEEIDFAKKLFESHKIDASKKIVMISILGSSDIKTYPLKQIAKVVDLVVEATNSNILFNYIPSQLEEAKAIYKACSEQTRKNIFFDVLGRNLREFIAIMNNCDMIIGNDGGAINMAKALGKPSFIIFSPWIEKKMWSTFEDGVFHKSVHLNDYRSDLFKNKSRKQLKRESLEIYESFEFKLFKDELKEFLKIHRTKQPIPEFTTIKSGNAIKLSALAITFNELHNIKELIASISFADEIIIVDSFSTDGTYEALLKYPNVKVVQREFTNFSEQRNYATSLTNNDWVLFVDADERVSPVLAKEIKATLDSPKNAVAFGFYRKSFFNGKLLRFGGFQSEKVYRLYHKEYATYDAKRLVHELLEINGSSKLLKTKLDHYSYSNDKDYKNKLEKYGKLRAEELYIKKLKPFFYHFYLKPAYRFFHLYIIRFGILDGNNGLKMALLSAYGVRQRYVALSKIYKAKK